MTEDEATDLLQEYNPKKQKEILDQMEAKDAVIIEAQK